MVLDVRTKVAKYVPVCKERKTTRCILPYSFPSSADMSEENVNINVVTALLQIKAQEKRSIKL